MRHVFSGVIQMKQDLRKRLCLLLLLLTALLTAIVWLTMPDMLLTGTQVRNGVRSYIHTPKNRYCLSAVCIPIIGGLLWNRIIRRVDRRIAAEPHLKSLRLRRGLIDLLGLLYTSAGVWGNLLVLILNM